MGLKHKQYLLGIMFMCAFMPATFAQVSGSRDTTSLKKTDSLLTEIKDNVLDNIPVVTIDENDQGDGGSGQNISSVLSAGRDPFYSAASFNFSSVRFRIRGYDNDQFSTFMNGIPMDNLDNGFTPYGLWGGLNDVMRNREVSYGLRYNTFTFGDIGSNTNIDSRASHQRKQTSFGYAIANRNYRHRWNLTHSTGLNKKGWAFTFSGSRRWADEGYVPGTYYDGWSYFAAVDKKINNNNLLSFTIFGAPTENGRQGSAVQEIMDLAGSNYYNPNWGYQNGKKRNASVGKSNQPVAILNHDAKLSAKTNLTTAVAYSWGDRSVTALDWYNAADPRPDYYRYLPSYYTRTVDGVSGYYDPAIYQQLVDNMTNNEDARQINWAKLYDANRGNVVTINDANGQVGNSVTGKRSVYILENRIINTKRFNVNSTLNTMFGKNIDFTAGATFQLQENNYYKKVEDLLGGDFYVDLNQFAERDFRNDPIANQNNLLTPNRILHEGDKYGYRYLINMDKLSTWAQSVFKFNKVDFFLAGQYSYTRFWRVGLVKNGLFPNDSYLGSARNYFNNYAVKGGVTYKIDGRNYLYVNASYQTKAPMFENVYLSPRTRNSQPDSITSEKIQTIEGGYIMNAPKVKIRLNGYYTKFQDGMDVMTFYSDEFQTFGNIALRNIDKVHFGGEFGAEVNVGKGLTVNAAASIGRYLYDSRQIAVMTVDNTSTPILVNGDADRIIYSKNFRVPSTPQEAYSLGATYRSPKFWFVSLTGNYYDQSWLSFSPVRRTAESVDGLEFEKDKWNGIIDQTKFDAQFMLDFFGGYSWKLPRKYNIHNRPLFLVFNLGVSNLLNNQDIQTGGFEQLRFDFASGRTDKFPPKLYYAYGINYFASATFRF